MAGHGGHRTEYQVDDLRVDDLLPDLLDVDPQLVDLFDMEPPEPLVTRPGDVLDSRREPIATDEWGFRDDDFARSQPVGGDVLWESAVEPPADSLPAIEQLPPLEPPSWLQPPDTGPVVVDDPVGRDGTGVRVPEDGVRVPEDDDTAPFDPVLIEPEAWPPDAPEFHDDPRPPNEPEPGVEDEPVTAAVVEAPERDSFAAQLGSELGLGTGEPPAAADPAIAETWDTETSDTETWDPESWDGETWDGETWDGAEGGGGAVEWADLPEAPYADVVAPTPSARYAPAAPHAAATPSPAPCVEPVPAAGTARPRSLRHRGRTRRGRVLIAATVVVVAAIVAIAVRPASDPDPTPTEVEGVQVEAGLPGGEHTSFVAEAMVPLVDVYPSPDSTEPRLSLEHPTEVGAPLVFLVEERRGDWLRVLLPVRPNGSTGWIQATQVQLSKHEYRVVITLSSHRLELFQAGEEVFHADVAVGTEDTPTPGGTFYIKELLKPPEPDTIYGNYAFGLSGFSNVVENFRGGEGVIGIHGTNEPEAIGQDVSSGCIRLTNEDMLELVGTLPLGTPVEIVA